MLKQREVICLERVIVTVGKIIILYILSMSASPIFFSPFLSLVVSLFVSLSLFVFLSVCLSLSLSPTDGGVTASGTSFRVRSEVSFACLGQGNCLIGGQGFRGYTDWLGLSRAGSRRSEVIGQDSGQRLP